MPTKQTAEKNSIDVELAEQLAIELVSRLKGVWSHAVEATAPW